METSSSLKECDQQWKSAITMQVLFRHPKAKWRSALRDAWLAQQHCQLCTSRISATCKGAEVPIQPSFFPGDECGRTLDSLARMLKGYANQHDQSLKVHSAGELTWCTGPHYGPRRKKVDSLERKAKVSSRIVIKDENLISEEKALSEKTLTEPLNMKQWNASL